MGNSETYKIKIYPMEQGNIVLFAPEYILINIEDEDLESITKKLAEDKSFINRLDENSVISLSTVEEFESNKKGKEICVLFKINCSYKAENLTMRDDVTCDQFFEDIYPFIKDNYSYSVKEFTPLRATVAPLTWMGIVLIAGAFFTQFAHLAQTQPITRTRVVKAYVAVIYKILKLVGPTPVVVITAIAFLGCVYYLIKRFNDPPIIMTIKKQED